MVEIEYNIQEKVKNLLTELFQFDNQELDFGIYRIMNFKREEIKKFIDVGLIATAEKEFEEFNLVAQAHLKDEVEKLKMEINRDFGDGTISEDGSVMKNESAPKVKDYRHKAGLLAAYQVNNEQINDVFNHIYEFFSRYYEKGDFISKRRYGGRDKYYIPYNGEDVTLHWANKDQYYIKTDDYFGRYSFKLGQYNVAFILEEADIEKNNVQSENKFYFLSDTDFININEELKTIYIYFLYRGLTIEEKNNYGSRNIQEIIIKDAVEKIKSQVENTTLKNLFSIATNGVSVLEKHLSNYIKKNTADYFIHTNLKVFLNRELDFYIKNEVLDLDRLDLEQKSIHITRAKVNAIREISKKIIEFLASIENFQKILFEKKKFVIRADYCLTLNMVPEEFLEEIRNNEAQIAEWKRLFGLDNMLQNAATQDKNRVELEFLKSQKNLVLDTKFFNQDFKDRLIASFKNLEEAIGGTIFKSENFQALNLLLTKFKETIDCIYIDPPFNTGPTEIIYKNNYKNSCWLTLMENRLELAKLLLHANAVLVVAIDDYELTHLCELLDKLFQGYDRNVVVVNHHPQGGYGTNITRTHEYALFMIPQGQEVLKGLSQGSATEHRPFMRSGRGENNFRFGRPNSFYAILVDPKTSEIKGIEKPPSLNQQYPKEKTESGWLRIYPLSRDGTERVWRLSYEGALKAFNNKKIVCQNGRALYQVIEHEERRSCVFSNWTDKRYNAGVYGTNLIADIIGDASAFSYPKSLYTVQDAIEAITHSNKEAYILDYFAGSGTTAHATLSLNDKDGGTRKYILIEMGSYFETVLKERIEKLMYSKEWKEGKPFSTQGYRHMFKYLYLEQYEDSLNNITFIEKDKTFQETLDNFEDYLLKYMLEFETRSSVTRLNSGNFESPFNYKIVVIEKGERKEVPVDLIETFNYLLGITVEKSLVYQNEGQKYRVIIGKKRTENILIIWRNLKGIDLEKEQSFIENELMKGYENYHVFINGDSFVKNACPIEPEFKRLMGA